MLTGIKTSMKTLKKKKGCLICQPVHKKLSFKQNWWPTKQEVREKGMNPSTKQNKIVYNILTGI